MGNDDRRTDGRDAGWNGVAPQGDRKLVRDAKLPADRLVGTVAERTATELMNELQASGGTNDKVLSDLQVRLGGVVMNQLRRAGVRGDVIEEVFADVWNRVWDISRKPSGKAGAWNPSHARHTSDPFVPWLKRVARSSGIDWHRQNGRLRKRRRALEAFVACHGEAWVDERGDWEEERQPGDASPKRRRKSGKSEPLVEKRAKGVPVVTRRQATVGRNRVAETVAALDERQRRVLELCAEGRTNVEIAVIVGCCKAEVSRRLTAARKAAIERLAGAVA